MSEAKSEASELSAVFGGFVKGAWVADDDQGNDGLINF